MTSLSMAGGQGFGNPIDLAEEIVLANQWSHDRSSDEELLVEIAGKWSDYRLLFIWQREIVALHFSCSFDMKVPKARRVAVLELLAAINERLWLGHFDLVSDDLSPAFRQGVLLRGAAGAAQQHALAERGREIVADQIEMPEPQPLVDRGQQFQYRDAARLRHLHIEAAGKMQGRDFTLPNEQQ